MAKATDVSRLIIEPLKRGGKPTVTNMTLNKLLYFAQGHCLARLGHPLFDDKIEAWLNAPVVPRVYHAFESFGTAPITSADTLSLDERDLLSDVLSEYGRRCETTALKAGSPWESSLELHDKEITRDSMRAYFSEIEVLPEFKVSSSIPVLTSLPADWYDPDEDAEWEAYIK
jgi:uncharacterized phage-associated protein